jgi:hypothetical protein
MAFSVKDYYDYLTTTAKDGDIILLIAVPDGGGGYNLRNITKTNWFKLDGDPVDFVGITSPAPGNTPIISIDGTTLLFFEDTDDIFKTVKGIEVQDGVGFMVASLNADGSLGLQGDGAGVQVYIKGTNVNAGDYELPQRESGQTPRLMGLGSSAEEIVTSTGSSEVLTHKGSLNFVEFNPGATVSSLDLELPDPGSADEGTVWVLNNISGNNISGITYTLNGATDGTLPTSLNAGDVKKIYLGGGDTWYEF